MRPTKDIPRTPDAPGARSLPGEAVEDVLGIAEVTSPPCRDGPPLHHHAFDEIFYINDPGLCLHRRTNRDAGGSSRSATSISVSWGAAPLRAESGAPRARYLAPRFHPLLSLASDAARTGSARGCPRPARPERERAHSVVVACGSVQLIRHAIALESAPRVLDIANSRARARSPDGTGRNHGRIPVRGYVFALLAVTAVVGCGGGPLMRAVDEHEGRLAVSHANGAVSRATSAALRLQTLIARRYVMSAGLGPARRRATLTRSLSTP
jgi:hypothetical protein